MSIETPNTPFVKYCVANLESEFENNKTMSLVNILRMLEIKYECHSKSSQKELQPVVLSQSSQVKEKKKPVGTPSHGFVPFSLEMKPKVEQEFPDLPEKERSYIVNNRWQKLSEAEREPYQVIASNVTKKEKKKPVGTPSLGFVPFSLEMKPKVEQEFPDLPEKERAYIVNNRWQKLSEAERKPYQEIASNESHKSRYNEIKDIGDKIMRYSLIQNDSLFRMYVDHYVVRNIDDIMENHSPNGFKTIGSLAHDLDFTWQLDSLNIIEREIYDSLLRNHKELGFLSYVNHMKNKEKDIEKWDLVERWVYRNVPDIKRFRKYPEGDIPFDGETELDTIVRHLDGYLGNNDIVAFAKDFIEFNKDRLKGLTPKYKAMKIIEEYEKEC